MDLKGNAKHRRQQGVIILAFEASMILPSPVVSYWSTALDCLCLCFISFSILKKGQKYMSFDDVETLQQKYNTITQPT